MKVIAFLSCVFCFFASVVYSQSVWQANLDSKIRFYQATDLGVVVVGSERSLYAIDGQSGQEMWRRDTGRINETAVTPIPDTDLILITRDVGNKSRLEALDLISGNSIWQSEKVKGDVLQLAVDPAKDLLAVVLVKDPKGNTGDEFKRKPIVHVLKLSNGDELWKRELDSDVEMMPARFGEKLDEVAYTLDNYRAPLLLDGRLFLFYEGATSFDARTGKEREREKFRINENGLALTEADPVFDDNRIYISGKGEIRAVNRRTGNVEWKADDLGNAAEMALVNTTLFVRTGGQFTRLKDGEIVSRGPYGVSAIDTKNGKVLWRYKGADKGLTNFLFLDEDTIAIADKDELFLIGSDDGEARYKLNHKVEGAQFVLRNERGEVVVGGKEVIAAFSVPSLMFRDRSRVDIAQRSNVFSFSAGIDTERASWRVRHKPPVRGAFRIIAGIALRATALYFRYGGLATSAIGMARTGWSLAGAVNSLRWSGLRSRFGSFDLTTLAGNAARNYVTGRIYAYGSLASASNVGDRVSGFQVITPSGLRRAALGRALPSNADVRDSFLDRLDPTRQAERLSDYLLRRKRLSELRGNFMYFYTDLPKPFERKGLIGVNIHNGRDGRYVLASDPDPQFVTDEAAGLLYSANGDRLQAFNLVAR